MENNFDYNQIEKYVRNELKGKPLAEFEKKVTNDADLAKEVSFYKELAEVTKLKGLFEEADKEMEEEEGAPKVFYLSRKILALAASVLVLLIATWWLVFPNKPTVSPEQVALANDNFVHYPYQKRGGDDHPTLYDTYKSKNYQKAAVELQKYATKNDNNQARLYSAIAYLGIDQPNKAIELLNDLEAKKELQDPKNYYLGLAYLKLGKKELAITSLKKVNSLNVFLHNKASALLVSLEK